MSLRRLIGLTVIVALALLATVDVDGQGRYRVRLPRRGGGLGSFSDTWTVQNTGWITEGVIIPQGQVPSGYGLQVGSFTTQTDCQATWSADGSCRHALVTFNASSTGAKTVTAITNPGGSYTPTWPSADISFAIASGPGAGNTYTATLPSFTSTNCTMNGALARRCWVLVPPKTGGVTDHALIQVIYEVTCYTGAACSVDYVFQNIKQSTSMDKMTLTTSANLAGSALTTDDDAQNIAQSSWVMHTGTRWMRTKTEAGLTLGRVYQSFEPWIAAKVVPRTVLYYDQTYAQSCGAYTDLGGGRRYDAGSASCIFSYGFGEVGADIATSEDGGRDELVPFADWDTRYIKTGTDSYRQVSRKTAKQSGGWTQANSPDGLTVTPLTATISSNNDSASAVSIGWVWDAPNLCVRGANIGGCSDSYVYGISTNTEREHVPDSNFIPYLLTGKKFYLDNLLHQANYMVMGTYNGATNGMDETDPYVFAGYYRGRGNTKGYLNDAEIGRSMGRPFRLVAHAAFAVPDSRSADRTYFKTLAENQLEAIGIYMNYLDSRTDINGRSWGAAPYLTIGMIPATHTADTWQRRRGASIASTTNNGDGTTTITVAAAPAGGIDDHGMLSGDYVDIAGLTTSGATALNGQHQGPITKISATQFKLSIVTTANTTSEGSWITITGNYFAPWRAATVAWQVDWMCALTGFFSCPSNAQAFSTRLAQMVMTFQSCSNYSTNPGELHNFYHIPGHVRGNNMSLYATCAAFQDANRRNYATGELFWSEDCGFNCGYANIPSVWTTYHRGSDLYNLSNPNEYYTIYMAPVVAAAVQRGVSGASTAYATLIAATGVENELKNRPGFYWDDTP